MLQRVQQQKVNKALDLFLHTQVAFAQCEANGIKIDLPYLRQAISETQEKIIELEHKIRHSDIWARWFEIFGENASLTARQQLGTVLFKNIKSPHPRNLGYQCSTWTDSGMPQVSEGSLEHIPELGEFAATYSLWMSLNKMLVTNLRGIESGLDPNGYLHPSFSLFSVTSFRTSSSQPNFQNFPNRDPVLAGVVRRCFIPREPDRHLVEIDYSGAEVRVNASINHDPTLLDSVNHGVDFHKSIAAMAYKLPEEEITKQLRQSVKGAYTFAAFYGSFWAAIAENLWDGIVYGDLKLKDGKPLKQHLAEQGITQLGSSDNPVPGTYYEHIRKTDEWFWNKKFKVYAAWKNRVWKQYLEDGFVDLPSGFRCAGIFTKNMVTNFPAQGSAAHCLLWSFIRLDKEIRDRCLKSCLCGQIHDSIVIDVPHDELDQILILANDIMTQQLPKAQKWLAVKMEVEADVSPMGKSWWDKKPYDIPKTEELTK